MTHSADAAIAQISAWLKRNGWTGHVLRNGSVEIRSKSTGAVVLNGQGKG